MFSLNNPNVTLDSVEQIVYWSENDSLFLLLAQHICMQHIYKLIICSCYLKSSLCIKYLIKNSFFLNILTVQYYCCRLFRVSKCNLLRPTLCPHRVGCAMDWSMGLHVGVEWSWALSGTATAAVKALQEPLKSTAQLGSGEVSVRLSKLIFDYWFLSAWLGLGKGYKLEKK